MSLSVLMAEATRLDSPVREGMQALARLGAGYFARHLELAALPTVDGIVAAAQRAMRGEA